MQTTDDGLLNNRIRILQPKAGYRVAIDTVFLAAAVPAREGERALDIGCGVGAAALCLATRCPGVHVTGIESQAELVDLARQNTGRNGLSDRVNCICGSLGDIAGGPIVGQFDHAMANPPYYQDFEGTPSPNLSKEVAQRRQGAPIGDWMRAALAAIGQRGTVTFIYPADRAADIIEALSESGAGAISILPLLPKAGRAAKRVVLQFRRGEKSSINRLDGLVLHRADGGFTDAAELVLRGAGPLSQLGA